jgi:YjbE family integral membrane protein
MDFSWLSSETLLAFGEIVMINIVLSGDNAIVIGLAAAGLPADKRSKAIFIGICAATVLRIIFAGIATWLLHVVGLRLAGGLLLIWVSWNMYSELRAADHEAAGVGADGLNPDGTVHHDVPHKTLSQAAWQIILADVSMSVDNVLAVAGAAKEHTWILISGLVLSIALMGLAASFIAGLLNRYRWIAYVGLAIIVYVGLDMIYRGAEEVWPYIASAMT